MVAQGSLDGQMVRHFGAGVGYERPSDLFDLFPGATYVVPASASTNRRRGASPDMDALIWDPASVTPED